MDVVQAAVLIVATFVAWLVLFFLGRTTVPGHVTGALAIGAALLVSTLGPKVLGG